MARSRSTSLAQTTSVQRAIAARLGVSQGIVSHILSGRRRVSTPLHYKIMEEWQRTGCQTNQAARTLRTGRTQTVALVLPDFAYLADFNRTIIQGMWEVALPNRQSLIITSMNTPHAETHEYLRIARQKQVDGMFFMQEHDLEKIDLEELRAAGLPSVFVNCPFSDPAACCVTMDGAAGMRDAVQHLIQVHGKRRIAWVCRDDRSPLMEDRFRGYTQALKAAGLKLDPKLVFPMVAGAEYEVQGVRGAEYLLKHVPDFDAVACVADYTAMGLIGTLRRHGKDVPGDIAVVGFDDLRHAAHFHPALTTVACDGRELGQQAMRMMLDLLSVRSSDAEASADRRPVRHRHSSKTKLVIRHSCGCNG